MRADGRRKRLLGGLLAMVVAAGAAGQDGDAVAIVDGRTVTREELVSLLIESRGLPVLQQLVLLELAKAETERRGMKVSAGDIDAEFERSLEEVALSAGLKGEDATRENKLKALQVVLEQRSISMAEYMVAMERNAHLRKCFEQEFDVDEATLREEFARTYGERVDVRHIQVSDLRKLNTVIQQLNDGADFAEVAMRESENPESAQRGGRLEPFTFDDARYPAAMREAAFSLKEGKRSAPVQTDRYYHILKLERRIPPQNVRFEDVREDVLRRMRERVEIDEMGKLLEKLFRKASIRVIDASLRRKYEDFLKKNTIDASPTRP